MKGKEYDCIKVSDNPLEVKLSFDSHGETTMKRIDGVWSPIKNDVYLPKDIGINEIGKAIEEQL